MSKLEEARRRLREAAGEYWGAVEWGAVDDAQLTEEALRQAAREFAAAELEAELPDVHPLDDGLGAIVTRSRVKWLRAGGLAKEVGDE